MITTLLILHSFLIMNTFISLPDQQAEVLCGGFWSFTKIDVTKSASTSVNQTNNASNTGVGALVGMGTALSWQANGAEVMTVIG